MVVEDAKEAITAKLEKMGVANENCKLQVP